MDLSGNIYSTNLSIGRFSRENDLQTRRLRLISDIMYDYQYNVRQSLRLISMDIGGADPNHIHQNEQPSHLRSNNIHTTGQRPPANNARRGYIYSQYIEPYVNRQPTDDAIGGLTERASSENEEGLTNEQIQEHTQSVQYSESMSDMRCPITWDQFDASHSILSINRCGHVFGETALRSWLQTHSRCPVCRTTVVETATATTTSATHTSSQQNTGNSNIFNNLLYRAFSNANLHTNNTPTTEYYENEIIFNDLTDFYSSLINLQNNADN